MDCLYKISLLRLPDDSVKKKLRCKLWMSESIWWNCLIRNLCEGTKSESKLRFLATCVCSQAPSRVTVCPCLYSTGPTPPLRVFCFSDSSSDSQSQAAVGLQESPPVDLSRFTLLGNSSPEVATIDGDSWLLGLFFHAGRKWKMVLGQKLLQWEWWDKSHKVCTTHVDFFSIN